MTVLVAILALLYNIPEDSLLFSISVSLSLDLDPCCFLCMDALPPFHTRHILPFLALLHPLPYTRPPQPHNFLTHCEFSHFQIPMVLTAPKMRTLITY